MSKFDNIQDAIKPVEDTIEECDSCEPQAKPRDPALQKFDEWKKKYKFHNRPEGGPQSRPGEELDTIRPPHEILKDPQFKNPLELNELESFMTPEEQRAYRRWMQWPNDAKGDKIMKQWQEHLGPAHKRWLERKQRDVDEGYQGF